MTKTSDDDMDTSCLRRARAVWACTDAKRDDEVNEMKPRVCGCRISLKI